MNRFKRLLIRWEKKVEKIGSKETARIMKTQEDKVRILIYEVSKENWGNARILDLHMKQDESVIIKMKVEYFDLLWWSQSLMMTARKL